MFQLCFSVNEVIQFVTRLRIPVGRELKLENKQENKQSYCCLEHAIYLDPEVGIEIINWGYLKYQNSIACSLENVKMRDE